MFDFPVQTFDAEIYPNFAMIGFRDYQTGEVRQFTSEPTIGASFADLRGWFADRASDTLFISFNGLAYDNVMCKAIIAEGVEDPSALFDLSCRTIQTERVRQERIGDELSLDLLAIAGGAKAKLGSLKECGIKMDFRRLEELPYPFDSVLTVDQMRHVASYNELDLEITSMVAATMAPAINGRIAITTTYGCDVLNRHDAGLAEKVVASRLFHGKPSYCPQTTWFLHGRSLTDGFHFTHPELIALRDRIAAWQMRFSVIERIENGEVVKSIDGGDFADELKIGDVVYRLGVGGLHSQDDAAIFDTEDNFRLIDFDVASFYPALIINHRLAPAHLSKRHFLETFTALRDARLVEKAAGNTALSDGLKVAVNSVFGKTKSAYSWLLDPIMSVTITVKGQLTLLKFVDLVADLDGVSVVSANTDGLTLRVRDDIADIIIDAMREMAASMGLELDQTEYAKICRRDVNNYVAVTKSGKIKGKGSYGRDKSNLGKKAVNRIVVEAVQRFLLDDVAVAETIRGCRSITEFVNYFKCNKGYVITDPAGREYGKIARWYIGTGGVHLDKRKVAADGKLTQLVERGACVINDLPGGFPEDVDYSAYEAMADDLIKAITEPDVHVASTIPIAELSADQRAMLTRNQTTEAVDLAVVEAVDLTEDHALYASVYKGNGHDSMKALLVRLWLRSGGLLSVADLIWLGHALDASTGRFDARSMRRMAEWVGRNISPFPKPQTPAEHIDRALAWAMDRVERAKVKRKMWHNGAMDSRYLSTPAMTKYAKNRELFGLACAICAASVKHDDQPDPIFLLSVLEDAQNFFERGGTPRPRVKKSDDTLANFIPEEVRLQT